MARANPFDDFQGLQSIRGHLRNTLPLYMAERMLTAAEVLALHTTAIAIVAGKVGAIHIPKYLFTFMDYPASGGAGYAAVDAGDDLQVRWTDVSGAIGLTQETIGFLDQTSDQRRFSSAPADVIPVDGAALVLALGGAITTGNSPVYCRLFYHTIPTAFGL